MNIFQFPYEARLHQWHKLRDELAKADLQTKCIKVDAWWQRAPLVNHYLHTHDINTWPGPWELLADNNYCTMARGLGMYYTLTLLGVTGVDFVEAKDDNDEDVVLVLVDMSKYILNWYPDTVLSNTLDNFTITARMDLADITRNIK